MPPAKRPQREPTEDWEQLRLGVWRGLLIGLLPSLGLWSGLILLVRRLLDG